MVVFPLERRVRFSLALPFHNERTRLPKQLTTYVDYIRRHRIEAEIICVDDASTDGSFQVVQELVSREKLDCVIVSRLSSPGFKYGAVQAAFGIAQAPLVGFVDTDDSIAPAATFALFDYLERNAGQLDVVLGSRFTRGQSRLLNAGKRPFATPDDHSYSLTTFKYTNVLSRLLYGLPFTDVEIGLKVLKNNFANIWARQCKCHGNIFFDAEMLWILRQNGARIAEVPIEWTFHDNIFEDQERSRFLKQTAYQWLQIAYYLTKTRLRHLLEEVAG